jgi:hypothetical protein
MSDNVLSELISARDTQAAVLREIQSRLTAHRRQINAVKALARQARIKAERAAAGRQTAAERRADAVKRWNQAAAMRESGYSYRKIAAEFGISKGRARDLVENSIRAARRAAIINAR